MVDRDVQRDLPVLLFCESASSHLRSPGLCRGVALRMVCVRTADSATFVQV
jgi:hypothetical protein